MSDASRARVTITIGRTGQVVKRDVSDVGFSDSLPGAGSKRSVRDRLGSTLDSLPVDNKRQRGDGYMSSLGTNGVDDVRIGKNDLRLKLMQKNLVRRAQSDDDRKFMDLREKLSRNGQLPHSSLHTRHRMPESKETSILGRIPVTSTNDLPLMNSSRSSYSAWTLDHIRRRSPERIAGSSRGLSPPRNVDLQRRPLSMTYDDDMRAVPYMSKDVHNAPRPMSTSPYMTKPALPPGSVKHVPTGPPLLGQLPPPMGVAQKSLYTEKRLEGLIKELKDPAAVKILLDLCSPLSQFWHKKNKGEEQQTVDGLLHSLGLGKYAILFKAEEVDMTALKQMGEKDLKELGIPMGPRKKIILALLPHSKRQP